MLYDRDTIATYFDDFGMCEWERLERSPAQEISLLVHTEFLQRYVPHGSRVLEIGPGPGRFTRELAAMGCTVVLADVSPVQLELNRELGEKHGFGASVEQRLIADIVDLEGIQSNQFDVVLAFGGPISYAIDRREQAVAECRRVVKPEGILLVSVMSLWGGLHGYLKQVLSELPSEVNREIIASGDITPDRNGGSRHACHMFTSTELRSLLTSQGLEILEMMASNLITNVWDDRLAEERGNPALWRDICDWEARACREPGCLDGGTHILCAARIEESPQ